MDGRSPFVWYGLNQLLHKENDEMGFTAKIIANSMAPCGKRLTTMEVTFPRIVLAEFNTHRQFSRNSASSRAIPVEKMLKRVQEDPFIPARFPLNEKGMQASQFAEPGTSQYISCETQWLDARDDAVKHAKHMGMFGIHKQIANRLLEPFLWHTVIVSSTEWSNFFAQRCHPDAQPEIQTVAYMMQELYNVSAPLMMRTGEYHLPFIQEDESHLPTCDQVAVSVARCARVSYLNHDGKRDVDADIVLYRRLRDGMHMSPLEHVAQAMDWQRESGNFIGWRQHRKSVENECR